MNFKSFMEWIDNNPRIRKQYDGSSYTSAHYLIEYCDWRANALRDLWIADDIIDHLMNESWATNKEFFENQDSVVLCRLCSYDWLRDFVNEKINEEYHDDYEELVEDIVDEISDYCEREMIVTNDEDEMWKIVENYIDKKDIYLQGDYTKTEFISDVVNGIMYP